MRPRVTTPPIVPPTIAPVLLTSFGSGEADDDRLSRAPADVAIRGASEEVEGRRDVDKRRETVRDVEKEIVFVENDEDEACTDEVGLRKLTGF
jgi:hypothetical protein